MFGAFKERRPWAVAVINLVFGPFLGMLYLGRARIAFVYLGLGFALVGLVFFLVPPPIPSDSLAWWLFEMPLNVIGAAQGAYLARKRSVTEPLPRYARWYSLVGINLASLLVAFAFRTSLYQPFRIPSVAMEPSLNAGDYFLVSKRAYDDAAPQRGDIVVFKMPNPDSLEYKKDFVKRVIGLPGDRIQMLNGVLHINGKAVPKKRVEDYVGSDMYDIVRPIARYREMLPNGKSYYVLDAIPNGNGDNTPIFTVPAGHYLVLGDNRDNSDDSRLSVGYVPAGDLVGKAVVKFVDGQHKKVIWEPID
jgi:signal peptidase I